MMRAPRHIGTIHGYAINKRTPDLLTTSQTGSARDRQHDHQSPVAAALSARVQPAARPDKRKSQLAATQRAPPGVQPAALLDKMKARYPLRSALRPIDSIIAEFPDLTRPAGVQREVRHNTVHHIRTTPGPPVTLRPRRLAPDRLAIAKAEFDAMLQDGTARRSESCWSSALHIVPKKDNGGVPVAITEPSTPVPFSTATSSGISTTTPTTFSVVPSSPKSTW
jgi:hypothetical protein